MSPVSEYPLGVSAATWAMAVDFAAAGSVAVAARAWGGSHLAALLAFVIVSLTGTYFLPVPGWYLIALEVVAFVVLWRFIARGVRERARPSDRDEW